MNNVNSETHNACSHVMSTKNFDNAKSKRKNIIGAKLPKKFCPPPSIADLKEAKAPPITFRTIMIAPTMMGSNKTAIKAKRSIKYFLSEALVFETTTRTAMNIIKKTITVAKINHNTKNKGSPIWNNNFVLLFVNYYLNFKLREKNSPSFINVDHIYY